MDLLIIKLGVLCSDACTKQRFVILMTTKHFLQTWFDFEQNVIDTAIVKWCDRLRSCACCLCQGRIILPGSAEAFVRWGGKIRHLFTAYFIITFLPKFFKRDSCASKLSQDKVVTFS